MLDESFQTLPSPELRLDRRENSAAFNQAGRNLNNSEYLVLPVSSVSGAFCSIIPPGKVFCCHFFFYN
ncbi:unnamed protein product [Protopolystoma xenopodis]|uniref:Uncharacterized protein n=1 Tax=Protopolystoma xenopodis TaxID=117903 RepID=A0A3S5CQN9_9PLAT|nr:unnamed protein product [Protopolystoma xenopodis]